MIPQEFLRLFENYRAKNCNEKERIEFEARLLYDSEFKSYYENYLELESNIKIHFQRNSLKSKLKEADTSIGEIKVRDISKPQYIRNIGIGLAAGIALLFGVYYNKPSQGEIATALWPFEEGLPVKMGEPSNYNAAMNAFKLEDWNKAYTLFSDFDSDTAIYFSAISQYHLEHNRKAFKLLDSIDSTSVFYKDAEIRLPLLQLKLGDQSEARKRLNKIRANKSHKYYDLAGRILNEI